MRNLASGFVDSFRRSPDSVALEVDGATLTYAELMHAAATLATTLREQTPGGGSAFTAVFGRRSVPAYSGILAALLRGHGYVPLNPTFPDERTQSMLLRSEARAVIVDRTASEHLTAVLEGVDRELLVVLPDEADVEPWRATFPEHRILGAPDLTPAAALDAPDVDDEALAYLLFTSGSTGTPKGVMVAHRNVRAFLDYVVPLLAIAPEDRLSQVSELTFDVSVFDMFAAWERAACVCCPSPDDLLRLDRFILSSRISVWFSVPSAAIVMRRLGALTEERFPTLRVSLFAGEPLPGEIAIAWSKAAPNSILENWYGPTELTIDCTRYRWTEESPADVHLGIVPIGTAFPEMETLIVDVETLRPVPNCEAGELLMTGPLMTPGYWNDVERTAQAYVVPPGEERVYYRTGDRVDLAPDGLLRHLGRVDHQIKVRGHRVELGEVEGAVRDLSGLEAVVAVGWPRTESSASGIEVFVEGSSVDSDGLRTLLAKRLPYYMVPRKIHAMEQLPLNDNGKFDRKQLVARLEAT